MRRLRRAVDGQLIVGIARERRARQYFSPLGARQLVARRHAGQIAYLDRAGLRMVPLEMRRIDVDAPDEAGQRQSGRYTSRVPRVATPARLPAVHPFARDRCIHLRARSAPRL